ncbi:MAG: hypothetical protein ACQER1_17130 [Armatimonadota bacterium]
MQIGFAAANITPSFGMEVPGGMNKRFTKGVHDELQATAAVFDDGEETVALVGVDALSIKRSVVEHAREIIFDAIGIVPEHVMCGASHTHAGGPAADIFDSVSDREYLHHMSRQIATAVIDANHLKEDLRVGVGIGEVAGVAHPRRWLMKDGEQRSHPRADAEGMDRPHGELDEACNVVGVADEDGIPRGCVVNFTCHGTTGWGAGYASADWIGYLRQCLKGVFGEDFGVVFLQGACGDITQVDNTADDDFVQSGPVAARRVGGSVAGETLKQLVQMPFTERMEVGGKRVVIELEPRRPTEEQLEWAREHVGGTERNTNRWGTDGIWAREWLNLAAINEEEPRVPCELQAIRIGESTFASNPGEFFCALGMDIKRGSPWENTFIVELANGSIGYVVTEDAYEGGYESQMAPSSKLVPGAGETIVAETIELLRDLHRG